MTAVPHRILVVANETVGGRALIDAVKKHAQEAHERGEPFHVTVICPQNQPRSGDVIYEDSVRAAPAHVTRTLVVANQTVGGQPLLDLLKRKGFESPHNFVVIMPQGEGGEHGDADNRLAHTLQMLHDAGLEAIGQVMDPDPFTAVQNALQFYPADEIVISTFPETRSGWLRSDLIERVKTSTSKPVEHVVVDVAPVEAEA